MSTITEDTTFSGDVKEEHGVNPEEDTHMSGTTFTSGLTDNFIGYGGEVDPDIE